MVSVERWMVKTTRAQQVQLSRLADLCGGRPQAVTRWCAPFRIVPNGAGAQFLRRRGNIR